MKAAQFLLHCLQMGMFLKPTDDFEDFGRIFKPSLVLFVFCEKILASARRRERTRSLMVLNHRYKLGPGPGALGMNFRLLAEELEDEELAQKPFWCPPRSPDACKHASAAAALVSTDNDAP